MANMIKEFLQSLGKYVSFDSDQQYKTVYYKANKVIQAQELLNDTLTTREDIFNIVKKTVPNYAILEGGYLFYASEENKYILSQTQFHYESFTINTEQKELTSTLATDAICIRINRSLVTHKQDSTLKDKHPFSTQPDAEGADRIKITGEWILKSQLQPSDLYFIVFEIEEFQIVNKSSIEVFDKPEYLRKYDFQTNGNYVIEGFDVVYERDEQSNFAQNSDFKDWVDNTQQTYVANNEHSITDGWSLFSQNTTGQINKQRYNLNTKITQSPYYLEWIQSNYSSNNSILVNRIPNVRNLSFKQATVSIFIKSNVAQQFKIQLRQYFGLGGSSDTFKDVGTINVTSTLTNYTLDVTVPNVAGKIIGTDSYLEFRIFSLGTSAFIAEVADFKIVNKYLDKGDFHIFTAREGIANVSGREISIPNNTVLKVPVSSEMEEVSGEAYNFTSTSQVHTLRNTSTREIIKIFGQKQYTETLSHGSFTGALDLVSKNPLFKILEVKQGATTYIENIDYKQTGDRIDWSLSGAEPAPGSSYTVKYIYIEYNINYTFNPYTNTFQVLDNLVVGTDFFVDYGLILPRYDRVILNRQGKIFSLEGTPSVTESYKSITADIGLHIANLEIIYKEVPNVKLVFNRPYKLSDINFIYDSLKVLNKDVKSLKDSNKSFNSLYSGDLTKMEYSENFKEDSELFDEYSESLMVNATLIPKVNYIDNRLYTQAHLIATNGDKKVFSNIEAINSYREINTHFVTTDRLGWLETDITSFKWVSDLSKKIYFKDVDIINDYQRFNRLSTDKSPTFTINVLARGFGDSEFIDIEFDNDFIKTVKADPNGEISTTVVIPANRYSEGRKKLQFKGLESLTLAQKMIHLSTTDKESVIDKYSGLNWKDSSTRTSEVSGLRGFEKHYTKQQWGWKGNPIYQNFKFKESAMVKSISVKLKDLTSDLHMYVLETSDGIPDANKVLTTSVLKIQDYVDDSVNEIFVEGLYIELDKEYSVAFVPANGSCKIGQVVQDLTSYIKAPESTAMFESFNNSEVLYQTGTELGIYIKRHDFTSTTAEVDYIESDRLLYTGVVLNLSDIAIMASFKSFEDATVNFKVVLVDRANKTYTVEPFTNLSFQKYTGNIQIFASFRTYNKNISAYLDECYILSLGTYNEASYYQTIDLPVNSTEVKVSIITDKSSDSTIEPVVWNGAGYDYLNFKPLETIDISATTEERFYEGVVSSSLSQTHFRVNFLSLYNNVRSNIYSFRLFFVRQFGTGGGGSSSSKSYGELAAYTLANNSTQLNLFTLGNTVNRKHVILSSDTDRTINIPSKSYILGKKTDIFEGTPDGFPIEIYNLSAYNLTIKSNTTVGQETPLKLQDNVSNQTQVTILPGDSIEMFFRFVNNIFYEIT